MRFDEWTDASGRGLAHDAVTFERAVVPTRVLWPGFALDTAFYAAIAFTLWSAPGVVRRRLRRARGRCAACGYDLTGAPSGAATCPECGSAASRRGHGQAQSGLPMPPADGRGS
jgi:predicted RNA-binding Zn-ribbon protein involved in translation (DUF1610 family)